MISQKIIIKPRPKWVFIDLKEIWRFKELFYIFAWRDIKVRYKQTILGIAWVVIQPFASMIIYTIFFGRLAGVSSGKLPYSIFVLSGLVFWNCFTNTLSRASDGILSNENIIKKVYFPKIILPLSYILTSLIDFGINLFLLIIYAMILGFFPSIWSLFLFPFALLLTITISTGVGLILASINVKYRDVRYILPYFIQAMIFLTPVIYPLSIVSERNKFILALNPMTTVVELTRFAFSGTIQLNPFPMVVSIILAFLVFLFGLIYFQNTEQSFTDVI